MTGSLGDRRSRVRFEIVGALLGTLELTETARLLNISHHGALIESPVAVVPDSTRSMQLVLGGQPVTVDVRVRHSRSVPSHKGPRYLIGVEFVAPPTTLLTSIERLETDDQASQNG